MKEDAHTPKAPVFPSEWAEILPEQAVLTAESLVESVYALHGAPHSAPQGKPVNPAEAGPVPPLRSSVLPPRNLVFRALELTPPQCVRAVILGQDPYPTAGHANGLAFSVNPHIRPIPPSLRNIFKEYTACFRYETPTSGDLTPWAERGVLLLNTVLTVRESAVGSHRRLGWQAVTDAILRACLRLPGPVAFLLWGRDAQAALDRAAVGCRIDVKSINFTDACNTRLFADSVETCLLSNNACHLESASVSLRAPDALPVQTAGEGKFLLPSSHPSPLGAAKPCDSSPPFIGSYPFLRANALLGELAIDWKL